MKILYIHQYFNTPNMPGSTRSYEFARRLVARGDTVYMITTNWQGKSKKSYSLIKGINVYWAPIRYNNKMTYLRRFFVFMGFLWYIFILGKKLDYDLIIASSTPLTIALPAMLLKRLKGVKMIFEIRDLWPQLPIAIGAIKSKFTIVLAKWLERVTYSNSNHIICLSLGMERELRSIIQKDKITVITNLCDVARFQAKKINNKSKIKIPTSCNKPLITYTGSFGRINGVVYLVEIANAMSKINSEISFLLTGNGYQKKDIINRSKEYGIYNNTLFCIDYLPKNQIPELLSIATITTSLFIDIPEMGNNSANKFFDALAASKPIMINYGGWQADLLQKTGCGFRIPSNDAENAALKLNRIINNRTKLKEMSKASNNLAKEFTVETNYQKFEQVVDNVISPKIEE